MLYTEKDLEPTVKFNSLEKNILKVWHLSIMAEILYCVILPHQNRIYSVS